MDADIFGKSILREMIKRLNGVPCLIHKTLLKQQKIIKVQNKHTEPKILYLSEELHFWKLDLHPGV